VTLVAAGLALSGCSVFSPATVTTAYAPSEGTQIDLSDPGGGTVKLRDVLIVGSTAKGPGALVAAVVNDGNAPVRVSIGLRSGGAQDSTVVTAPPQQLIRIGPNSDTSLTLSSVPAPGSIVQLTVGTQAGGAVEFNVPVVAPQGPYATLTPSASSSTAG
jgi:hypothetical protein